MASLVWPSTVLLVEETKSGTKHSPSWSNVFTFGHRSGKGKIWQSLQEANGSMRVGQPAYIKSLDFVPLGKLRMEQSGDANVSEKTAMRSVLGAFGYLARESRPDLSEPVSFLQSRFNKAQVFDIQETHRVVRLAKAHKDLALPVCTIPLDQICLMEMPVVETPVLNEHKQGMSLCLLTGPCWKEWRSL